MANERDDADVSAGPRIEPTPNAKKLQLKSWTCKDCGSRHSREHDAELHWRHKHGKPA
jgi:hypothetical protein